MSNDHLLISTRCSAVAGSHNPRVGDGDTKFSQQQAGQPAQCERDNKQPITRFKAMKMETKAMSANPHSVVHAREYYEEVEKVPEAVRNKGEPGVAKGVVRDS